MYKGQITQDATIYMKTKKRELTDFEKHVNAASVKLCLNDTSLLKKRGELLTKARKEVADTGYIFKKGHSRSKVYGQSATETAPKRPKYDKEIREKRLEAIDDELHDIAKVCAYKERRLSQAEAGRNYSLCEQITEEMMSLKSKKRELDTEKHLFEQKDKRAKRRQKRKFSESDYSDLDSVPSTSTNMSITSYVGQSSPTPDIEETP